MTCIIALKKPDGSILLGSDRAMTSGQEKSSVTFPKIWTVGNFAMGASGAVQGFGLAKHVFVPPPRGGDELYEYLVRSFGPTLKALFKEHDLLGPKDGYTGLFSNSELLLVSEGRMFKVWSDFSVTEESFYASIGSGSCYALGALYANQDKQAEDRVYMALMAAKTHCASVDGPFDYLVLENKEPQRSDPSIDDLEMPCWSYGRPN